MLQTRLTQYDREKIEYYLRCKLSIRQIASIIHKHHTVISREIKRHTGQFFPYSANVAQKAAQRKSRLTNRFKLDKDRRLRSYVEQKLKAKWSPEQIAGRLKTKPLIGLSNSTVSHESIYRYIYANNSDGQYLYHYLRKAHPKRKKWYSRTTQYKIVIPDRTSIHNRESIINNRKRFGDWESDSVTCKHHQAISVQLERQSKLVRISKLNNHSAEETSQAISRHIELSNNLNLWKSMTFDNGSENTKHIHIRDNYEVNTYFCDPYSSWQKGSIENINGLIRQYLSRQTDLSKLSNDDIYTIQESLNNRPRKTLHYLTPNEILEQEIIKSGALNS